VPIRWDLTDEELYPLLDSINGVFFAGGGSDLVDMETGDQSVLYQLAVKIFDYMKVQKDEKGIEWPIHGICQGFEIIHYLANCSDKSTLSNVDIYGESRPMIWNVEDPKRDSRIFSVFPQDLVDKLDTEGLALHAHTWTIKKDTYEERKCLRDFYNIIATDVHEGDEFVVAVESPLYPISGTMFHPETQNRHIVGCDECGYLTGKVNDPTSDALNFYYSKYIRD
jgi:hypothetical protein